MRRGRSGAGPGNTKVSVNPWDSAAPASRLRHPALGIRRLPLPASALAAFLVPIVGGQLPIEVLKLEPGAGNLIAALITGQTPLLAYGVLTGLVVLALAGQIAVRRVVQFPFKPINLALGALTTLVLVSILFSDFLWVSIPAAAMWVAYAIAFYAGAAVSGRRWGPTVVLGGLVAGCAVVAAVAILEYAGNRPTNPSWRVFGTWQNPNALAAILILGIGVSMGLSAVADRVGGLMSVLATGVIGFALALTQSKGGFLAAGMAVVAFALAGVWWARPKRGDLGRWGRVGGGLAVAVLLIVALRLQPTPNAAQPQDGFLGRVTQATQTSEQSAGFRQLLWRGTVQLALEAPQGLGPGTYRFYSARPGLTVQTQLSHNSYLQLAAESGVLALLALLAFVVLWLREVMRGVRGLTTHQNLLRAGILAGAVGVGVHSFIDSDLHYFGVGYALFLVMGVAMPLSADGIAPESLQKGTRGLLAAVALGVPLVFLYAGWAEVLRGQVRADMDAGRIEDARSKARRATELLPGEGEGWYQRALLATSASEHLEFLQVAARVAPTSRNIRAVARAQVQAGEIGEALQTLDRVFERDPNNLPALERKLELLDQVGRADEAVVLARRIVAIEETPYFRIRAIPELVPTQTFAARLFLAQREPEPRERIALLLPALDGYAQYRDVTAPRVRMGIMPGESVAEAKRHLAVGLQVAELLAQDARATGDADLEARAVREKGLFRDASVELMAG